jgi:hypothetical protein
MTMTNPELESLFRQRDAAVDKANAARAASEVVETEQMRAAAAAAAAKAAVCHIRAADGTSFCSQPFSESISIRHYLEHVVPTKDECCKSLFVRLCRDCSIIASLRDNARGNAGTK